MKPRFFLAPLIGALLIAPFAAGATFDDLGLHPFLSYSAAGEGMGNAVVSLPADPTNLWINPGGLAFQKGWTVYLSPADEVRDGQDDLRDRVFTVSKSLGRRNGIGAALIARDKNNIGFRTSEGSIGVADILEKSLLLSYARRFGERFGAGATLIGFEQTSGEEVFQSDRTVAFTAGVLARFPFILDDDYPIELRTGASLANAGATFDMGSTVARLPLYARLGVSLNHDSDRLTGFTLAADVYSLLRNREVWVEDDQVEVRNWLQRLGAGVGGEIRISGVVAVRGGYLYDEDITGEPRSGGTFGFDVGHRIYRAVGGVFEYSRSPASFDTADHVGIRIYLDPEYF